MLQMGPPTIKHAVHRHQQPQFIYKTDLKLLTTLPASHPMATGARRGRRRNTVHTVVPPAPPDTTATNDPSQPILAGLPPAPATTRTNRNRRRPMRYRDTADDSEFIDIDVIDESSGNDDIVDDGTRAQPTGLPLACTLPAAQTTPNAGIGIASVVTPAPATRTTPNLGGNITMTNPLETGRNAPPTSADIRHFFKKEKLKDTICKVCM